MPEACLLCGRGYRSVCLACLRKIQLQHIDRYIPYACNCCGYPQFAKDDFCPYCSLESNLPYTIRIFFYNGVIQELLELYNHTRERKLIPLLGHLLYKKLMQYRNDSKEKILIPIPDHCHTKRTYHDGRMYPICRYIANTYGLSVCDALVYHTEKNILQPNNHERPQEPYEHTFTIKKTHVRYLKGKSLCVIDDRIITGTTLKAARSALWRAEPKEISALVLAMD